jgi:hypothetical protein
MPLACPFQVLYYDTEGKLCSNGGFWEGTWELAASEDSALAACIRPVGKPQAAIGAGSLNLRGDLCLEARLSAGQGIPMITNLELGEITKPSANRPGLILCRAGSNCLWDIAKEAGTTVEAVKRANHLQDEPPADKVLIIPIP